MIEFAVGAALGALVAGGVAVLARRRLQALRRQVLEAATEPSAIVHDPAAQAVLDLRERLERRLRDEGAEAELRSHALDAVPVGVLLVDESHRVVYANDAARALTGGPVDASNLRHGVLREVAAEALGEGTAEGILDDPVSKRTLVVAGRRTADRRHAALVIRDETELRRLAAIRRDFVADASHELKTPVTSLHAALETAMMALADDDADATERFVRAARDASARLSSLVTDLLDLSRLETAEPDLGDVELESLVDAVLGEFGAARPRPALATTNGPVFVRGSASDLALAVRNLVANAIQYTPDEGSVELVLSIEGREAVIEVTDTGAGIPTKDLPRIFERFYRVDPARSRATGGTGLGLAIVRHIAQRHGGGVSVESSLGSGSTFRLRLPLSRRSP